MNKTRSLWCVFFSISLVAFMLPLLTLVANDARADFVGTFIVDGTVKDDAGRPMADVPVVVVSKHGETIVSTDSGTTDADGFYTVTLPPGTVDYDHTIVSTATYGGDQVSEEVAVDNEFGVTINLQFPFEIPQFGTLLGFLVAAGAVGAVAIVLLRRFKATKH